MDDRGLAEIVTIAHQYRPNTVGVNVAVVEGAAVVGSGVTVVGERGLFQPIGATGPHGRRRYNLGNQNLLPMLPHFFNHHRIICIALFTL